MPRTVGRGGDLVGSGSGGPTGTEEGPCVPTVPHVTEPALARPARAGRSRRPPAAVLAAGLLAPAALATASCGSGAAGQARPAVVEVLLPASMEPVSGPLARAVEQETPGVELRVRTAGSNLLAASVVAGAPADVLVVAGRDALSPVAEAGLLDGEPRVVARNSLVLVTPEGVAPPGRPVRGAADLAREDLVVAVCDPAVPCGALAERAAAAAGVQVAADTREPDVRAVLQRVRSGEADLGAVYATDAEGADDVRVVPLADAPTTTYPAVALRGAQDPGAAREVVRALAGPRVQGVLRRAGFG